MLKPSKAHPPKKNILGKYKNIVGIVIDVNHTENEVAILWPKNSGLSLWWGCDALMCYDKSLNPSSLIYPLQRKEK